MGLFGKKDFQKGMEAGAKPFEDKFKQQADAINRVSDKLEKGIEKVSGVVHEVVDGLTSIEKKRLYDLNTQFDIKNLEDHEKELLLAGLFTLAGETANENQQAYVRSVKKYLDIKNPQTDIDLSGIENLSDLNAQKAIFNVFAEFLFLSQNDFSFLDKNDDLFDLFSVKRKDRDAIITSIQSIYNAVGAQGLCEHYGFVADDGKGLLQTKENVSFVIPDTVDDSIEAHSAVISSDGKYVAFFDNDGIQIMDTQSKEMVHKVNESSFASDVIAVSSSGNLIVKRRVLREYTLWDIQKEEEISYMDCIFPFPVLFSFSPDSKRLAYILKINDCALEVIKTQDGNRLLSINGKENVFDNAKSLAYSQDGRYLAVLSDETGFIFDARNGSEVYRLENIPDELLSRSPRIIFSHNGKHVLILLHNGLITIWDAQKRSMLLQIGEVINEEECGAICLSPDDKIIVAGYSNGIIRFHNTETGEQLKQLQSDKSAIEWLSYTPDGKTLISYTGGNIKFWVSE